MGAWKDFPFYKKPRKNELSNWFCRSRGGGSVAQKGEWEMLAEKGTGEIIGRVISGRLER